MRSGREQPSPPSAPDPSDPSPDRDDSRPKGAIVLTAVPDPAGWQADAACRDADAELFFSLDESRQQEALALCAECPVRRQCLEHALAHGEQYGIWGGLREGERRRLMRDRRHAA